MPSGRSEPVGYPRARLTARVASYVDGARSSMARPCSSVRSTRARKVEVSSSLTYPANVASPEARTGAPKTRNVALAHTTAQRSTRRGLRRPRPNPSTASPTAAGTASSAVESNSVANPATTETSATPSGTSSGPGTVTFATCSTNSADPRASAAQSTGNTSHGTRSVTRPRSRRGDYGTATIAPAWTSRRASRASGWYTSICRSSPGYAR